ncbi:hypothetical protein sos41_30380 [Alphaproteobacteria bacterium SO-S41]|nr:hypothetical protein sos41_30380 [Alphaproteobacteria bacterium SO-S41]
MATSRLDIRLAIDPARARQWHRALADELRRRGHSVAIALRPGGRRVPQTIGVLLALESVTGKPCPKSLGSPWAGDALSKAASVSATTPQLEIDVTGQPRADQTLRTLSPVYDDGLVEEAAVAALIAGYFPAIGIRDSNAAASPLMTHPGLDSAHRVGRSLDNLGARLVALFARAVDAVASGQTVAGNKPLAVRDANVWHASDALGALTFSARRLLKKMLARGPHWYVGWRRTVHNRAYDTLAVPAGGWTRLPDDGKRFYADPFVATYGGKTWILVEEFPYATGRGIISAVELGPNGPIDTPRPVLETGSHLSYPFIFERDGQMWMIPESAENRTVDLYRAEAFPDRWVHVATLLKDIPVGDVTIADHGGKLWMFGTVGEGDASSWDALHLWSAEKLEGPWHAHGDNPVLMDALGARPGGAFYRKDGALWRPAQDCTTGYGVGLALCQVTKLDDDGFEQEIKAVLRPGGPDWPGTGLHTLNWAAGVEVVDGCQDRRR